ncbi:hypothetical protein MRX96_007908 [Rhipicephalus microplus]
MTTKLTMTPPGISVLQRYRLMQIRSEYGIHYMFSTPHNVLTQKLSFEFATGFLKNSTLTYSRGSRSQQGHGDPVRKHEVPEPLPVLQAGS